MGQAAPYVVPAVIGAAGNMMSAKQANKPRTTRSSQSSTQTTRPFGGSDRLSNYLGLADYALGYGLANSPYGPSEGMNTLSAAIRNKALAGRGGRGGGRGVPYWGKNVGGGGISAKAVSLSPEQIAQFFPNMNPYMKEILEGGFLGENPYSQDIIDAYTRDTWESYSENVLPEIDARFARAGRTGPSSAAYQGAVGNAYEDYGDTVSNQIAQLRYSDYLAERANMMQALGLYSGETNAARGNLTGMRNADVASQTAIRQATIAANAAIEQARIAAAMQGRALSLQEEQMMFNQMLQAYGVEQSQLSAQSQGALIPMNLVGQYGNMIMGPMAQFGTTTSNTSGTNIQPGAGTSPWASGLLGGLGGYMWGKGIQGQNNPIAMPAPAPSNPTWDLSGLWGPTRRG